MDWNPQGKRRRGRPKQTWRRSVHNEALENGKSWSEVKRMARDWTRWRHFVDALDGVRRSSKGPGHFTHGTEGRYPLNSRLGRPQSQNLLSVPVLEPRTFKIPTTQSRNLILCRTWTLTNRDYGRCRKLNQNQLVG